MDKAQLVDFFSSMCHIFSHFKLEELGESARMTLKLLSKWLKKGLVLGADAGDSCN